MTTIAATIIIAIKMISKNENDVEVPTLERLCIGSLVKDEETIVMFVL